MRSSTTLRLFGLAIFILVAVLIWSALAPLRAQGHTGHQLDEWVDEWVDHYHDAGGVTLEIIADLSDMRDRHPWYFDPPPSKTSTAAAPIPSPSPSPASPVGLKPGTAAAVEPWRSLIAAHFPGGEVDRALCIISYESAGNPGAISPTNDYGLFQIHAPLWAPHYGVTLEDLLDPGINASIAADLHAGAGWTPWTPYRVRGYCH